jgi:cytochrome P450
MDWPIFMIGTSETWRKGRKLLDSSLRPGALISYRQMMQEKTRNFLAQLRANPKDFRAHIELSVDHLPYIAWLLTAGQTPRKTHHVTYIWLRPERG